MKQRILILVHEDLVPPANAHLISRNLDDFLAWETEYDVLTTLKSAGHIVEILGVYSDLKIIRDKIESFKPHIVFNLLEEFLGEVSFDQNIVSYLELLGTPYTGNNPRALMLARDKALTKKILNFHRIPTAKFQVFPRNKRSKLKRHLKFPLIVKCLNEEASLGISKESVVHSPQKLYERVKFVHTRLHDDALVEEFISGNEYYVGIFGNYKLHTLPILQLHFSNSKKPEQEIYSNRAKFNGNYRRRLGIKTTIANLPPKLEEEIIRMCKKCYRILNLNGYARIDIRVDSNNNIYLLEANPNPNIAQNDEFAISAKADKISYPQLLEKIIRLGLRWSKHDSH